MYKKLSLITLCFYSLANAETIKINITGIKKYSIPAWESTKILINSLEDANFSNPKRLQTELIKQLNQMLKVYGFYEVSYKFQINENHKITILKADVTLAPAIKLNPPDIVITGGLKNEKEFQELYKKLPKAGSNLNHIQYDSFKKAIEELATELGYFDAKWQLHRLEIDLQSNKATWKLHFDSGQRYKFGKIDVKQTHIDQTVITNLVNIKPDTPYSLNKLNQTNDNLSNSDWFNRILIIPTVDQQNKIVDLEFQTEAKKKNIIDLSLGYQAKTPTLNMNWNQPWTNGLGFSLLTKLDLSIPKQAIEAGYKIPLKNDPLNHFYQFTANVQNENFNDNQTNGINFLAQRFWNTDIGWAFALGLQTRFDRSIIAKQKTTKSKLIYPIISFSRFRTDNPRFPNWGDAQKLVIFGTNQFFGSDVSFFNISLSSAWLRTVNNKHRFIERFEINYLKTHNFNKIPTSLRYFIGGNRSIRGYEHKSVAPKDAQGNLIGGLQSAILNLEYQYRLTDNWWIATFLDIGSINNNLSFKTLFNKQNFKYGTGLGIRWNSPIGTLKFDIATPLNPVNINKKQKIQLYFGIGADL